MRQNLTKLGQRGNGFIAGIVSFVFGVIVTLLALRFIFRLLNANPDHGFVDWIYGASEPFVRPFFGIFRTDIDVASGRFEIETLIALIVYAIVAALVMRLFGANTNRV